MEIHRERARLGRRLRALRRAQDLTLKQLGEMAGVNANYLGQVERGEWSPTYDLLLKLSSALDIDVHQITCVRSLEDVE